MKREIDPYDVMWWPFVTCGSNAVGSFIVDVVEAYFMYIRGR